MSPSVLPDADWFPLAGMLARDLGLVLDGKISKMSTSDFLAGYSGPKRKRYETAVELYQKMGLKDVHSLIAMFVKPDPADPVLKGSYDPRAIQGRHPVYNYRLGLYTKPLEHELIGLENLSDLLPHWSIPRGRCIAKGLNAQERGDAIAKKFQQFNDPVAVGGDASRFDQHVSKLMLEVEHLVYLFAYRFDGELDELLEKQLKNMGYTTHGIKYCVHGKRMSGDMNTGLGNSIIMFILYVTFATWARIAAPARGCAWDGKWDFICDGDDSVFFTERHNLQAFIDLFPEWCRSLGFKMEIEPPVYTIQEIDFCQARPIRVGGKWVLVRNPRKALSTSMSIKRKVRNLHEFRKHMSCVGICELALNSGIPVMQAYATALIANGVEVSSRYLENFRLHTSWRYATQLSGIESKSTEISWETRSDFELAFGIPPSVQMLLEEQFRNWDLSTIDIRHCPAPLDCGGGSIITEFNF